MTEKQLREGLHAYLSSAGIPARRKQELLRRIRLEEAPVPEKGEPNMFRPNKFRTALIAAVIVTLLSFTVALGAGLSGFINMRGERVDMPRVRPVAPTPAPARPTATHEPDFFTLANDILRSAPAEYMVQSCYVRENSEECQGRPIQLQVDTYEQLAALVGDDSLMLSIPEGWAYRPGYVILSCAEDSAYELVSEETTPEGITVSMYRIPEGKAVVREYGYTILDADGHLLSVNMSLRGDTRNNIFQVREVDTFETPALPGMEEALLLTRPDVVSLIAYREMEAPVRLWTTIPSAWDRGRSTEAYVGVEFVISTWDDLVGASWNEVKPDSIMLSMFDK